MSSPWVGGWTFSTVSGEAAELHARSAERIARAPDGPLRPGRTAWILRADRPALVLGSAEPIEHVDRAAAAASGIEVVRRRSGGGAVLVGPGRCVWIDFVIGREDPLWDDDIGRAAWWVGEVWAGALHALGVPGATAWRGPLVRSPWSDRACFAGLGPGEVSVLDAKVVGVSQRRTRAGALFQCAALLDESDPARTAVPKALTELVALQTLDASERSAMLGELRRRTFALIGGQAPALEGAVRSQLVAV